MTINELLDDLEDVGTTKVKVAIADIDGVLRGKMLSIDKFKTIVKDGFGFCNVVFGWDCGDIAYENGTFSGWHTGYPDVKAYVDISTFREIPWENGIPFFIADFSGTKLNEKSLHVCPRTLLKKLVKGMEEKHGMQAKFSQEFEWFNFDETPASMEEKGHLSPNPLTPGMFGYSLLRSSLNSAYFNDLFDLLGQFDIPIEGIHTETGPGVYEAAIAYDDILVSADRALLFKNSVKEIAYRHEIMASFMAKWSDELPGCGGHVHQSLWKEGKNLFHDGQDEHQMSATFKSFIAGQLHCLPHILPMFAPTINSFKRLVEGAWAPTNLTWGIDNRTVSLRALPGGEKSARLECRVPGSDTNPYLVMAACLASGLYGIENNMQLEQAPVKGNGYVVEDYGRLPTSLALATEKMKKSAIAKELFGEGFVKHFTETREWECRQENKEDPNWELKRYFEII